MGFTITHTPTQEDGGGYIEVVFTDKAEAIKNTPIVGVHKDLPTDKLCAKISRDISRKGEFKIKAAPQKRPWYEVDCVLGERWTKPHIDTIARYVGLDSLHALVAELDEDITERLPHPIKHTYIVGNLVFRYGRIFAKTYVTSQDWNGKCAKDRAARSAEEYLQEEFGERELVREFIETGAGGLYKRNPKYGTGFQYPVKPLTTHFNRWFLDYLADRWLERKATKGQQEVVAACVRLAERSRLDSSTSDVLCRHYLYFPQLGGTVYWGRGEEVGGMDIDTFRSLGDDVSDLKILD